MPLCQTALAKGLRKFANDLFLFRGCACATWVGVCWLMYMPLRLKRVCASAVFVSIDWEGGGSRVGTGGGCGRDVLL